MKFQACQSCKIRIPPGGTFYICSTKIICGFDGFLPESDEDPETLINSMVSALSDKSAEEIMEDVYQEITLVLCNSCRLKLRERVLSMVTQKGKGKVMPFPGGKERKK